MSVKQLPRFQRPREKLIERGVHNLNDLELVMLLLQSGGRKADVHKIATTVMRKGKIQELARKSFSDLRKIQGIGEAKACVLVAACELAQRLVMSNHIPLIETADDILKIVSFIRNKRKEYFIGIYMNARQQLIQTQVISIGSVDASIAHPREVYEPAVRLGASSLIIAHNHPSGDPDPSHADVILTKRLHKAGALLGIDLIDHIIIAQKGYVSLREAQCIT